MLNIKWSPGWGYNFRFKTLILTNIPSRLADFHLRNIHSLLILQLGQLLKDGTNAGKDGGGGCSTVAVWLWRVVVM